MSDVFFPIVSADQTQMATVRCDCLNPKDYPAGRALVLARDEQEIERILADARATESIGAEIARPIWVRFTPQQFTGRSYGLALALADKLARYQADQEAIERRLFATGVVAQDGAGQIESVDGFEKKLAAIFDHAEPGDVVVLPRANVENADQTTLAMLESLTSKRIRWHSIDHLSAFEAYWIGGGDRKPSNDVSSEMSAETADVTTPPQHRSLIRPWHLGTAMITASLVFLFWPVDVSDRPDDVQHRLVAEQSAGQAGTAFEKACEGGDMAGCAELGHAYREGRGVDRDFDRAEAVLIKACGGFDASGCAYLDRLYREELGGKQRFLKAEALFQQACDKGYAWGCSHYSRLYRDGLGVERDYATAGIAFRQACEGGDPPACSHLGILYRDGKGVDQNKDRAQSLFQKACDGGFSKGCTYLGMLQAEP